MKLRLFLVAGAMIATMAFLATPALAKTLAIDHGGTYWGTDVVVAHDQIIDGDVNVFFGDAIVEGTVNGDVNDFGGTVEQRPGSVITGKPHVFSGEYLGAMAPWAAGGASMVLAENKRMMSRLAYSVIVLLVFLIFPMRVRLALDRLEQHPGLAAGIGMVVVVAVLPVMILLIVSIIGIPLIPVEFAAVLAGIVIGQAALGILVGRRLFELVNPRTTPSPLGALVLGLVILSAAEIVPGVGGLITILVALVGLGAAALAFVGGSGLVSPRSPVSGPPMRPA